MRLTPLILIVAAAAIGCVRPEQFRPTATDPKLAVPTRPQSQEYKIESEGQRVAEVLVRSEGAYDENGVTIVHVGFEIDSHHNKPLRLAFARMVSANTDEGPLANVPSREELGDLTVMPGQSGKSDIFFELPNPEVSPQNLDGFTIDWVVDAADLRYEEATPFVEVKERPKSSDDFFTGVSDYHPFRGEGVLR